MIIDRKNMQYLRSGFTFVELIVAVTILAVLAAVAVPTYMRWAERSRETTTEITLKNLKNSIEEFKMDSGKYPDKLEDLIKRPANVKKYKGPYYEETPLDGWGNEFVYRATPKGQYQYDLFAESPKGDRYEAHKK